MPALGDGRRPYVPPKRGKPIRPVKARRTPPRAPTRANVYVPPASLADPRERAAARRAPRRYTFDPAKVKPVKRGPSRPIAGPSPDARDVSSRSPAQKRHDAKVVVNVIKRARHDVAARPFSVGGGDFGLQVKPGTKLPTLSDGGRAKERIAPVLHVLEQTMRPIHAIAAQEVHDVKKGGLKELVAVHAPGSKAAKDRSTALKRGWQLKDKSLSSDVLGAAGWNPKSGLGRLARGAVGATLDVAQDPGTLVMGGTGSVAEKAAVKAVAKRTVAEAGVKGVRGRIAQRGLEAAGVSAHATEEATREATKKGGNRAAARAVGGGAHAPSLSRRAGERAAAQAKPGKGVKITFAGAEIPVVRRSTAALARGGRKATRKVSPRASQAIGQWGRKVVREVRPMIRPTGEVTQADFAVSRGAARSSRAHVSHADTRAYILARALRTVPEKQHEAFIDALERDRIGKLPESLREHAVNTRSELRHSFREARRAGAVKGKVGDTSKWLTSGDLRRLRSSVKGEAGRHERRVGQLEAHVLREQGRSAVAEQEALGRARTDAARQTERARGAAKTTALKQRHAGDIEYERALSGAKVSVAKPKTTDVLKGHLRDLSHASRAHATARTAERRAKAHLKRVLARPGATRQHVAGAYAKVTRATRRTEEAHSALATVRQAVRGERQRIKGVAPREADRLRQATERRGPVKAEPVQRVEPAAPASSRMAKAAGRRQSREQQLAEARARLKAAESIPQKSALETTEQWLNRLHAYAKQHDLGLVEQRAAKLLGSKPNDLARGYFPRDFDDRVVKQLGLKPSEAGGAAYATTGPSRKVSRVTPGFRRADQRRLLTTNAARVAADQTPFSTHVPLVVLNHLKNLARATSQGEFAKEMAKTGRPVKSADDLRPGEAVYHLGYRGGQFGLHPVNRVPVSPRSGQYVALNRTLFDEMEKSSQRVASTAPLLRGYDKVTGGFRRAAIASIAFHVRNAIGDVQQAYLVTPGHELPRNLGQAVKATRRANEQAKTLRPGATDATIKVAGRRESVDDFLAGARKHGVLDAGQAGRELHELSGENVTRVKKVSKGGTRVGRGLQRWATNRENTFRLATYKAQRDRGLSEREAADIANEVHVDYGELSVSEREVLRRLFPFYTWTARTAPLMVKMLVSRPGKFANVEKVRQEFSQASGMNEDEVRAKMTQAVQRQLPVTVKIGKNPVALSWSSPTTLLNELPTGLTPKALGEWGDELGRFGFGMANPFIKAPVEWRSGKNLVTKADIENSTRPLTAAPGWVKHLPDPLKRKLDVTEGYKDPKTGKKTLGWRGRADWAYDQLMLGWVGQGAQLVGSGRTQSTTPVTAAGIAGIRADSLNKTASTRAQQQPIRDEYAKIGRQLGILRQTGITAENATPTYRGLLDRYNALGKQLQGKPATTKKAASGSGYGDLTGGSGDGGGYGDLTGGSSGGGGGYGDLTG